MRTGLLVDMNSSVAVTIDRESLSTYPGIFRIVLARQKLMELGIWLEASKGQCFRNLHPLPHVISIQSAQYTNCTRQGKHI